MRYIITISNNRIATVNLLDTNLTIEQGQSTTIKTGTYEELFLELEHEVENIEFLTQTHEQNLL